MSNAKAQLFRGSLNAVHIACSYGLVEVLKRLLSHSIGPTKQQQSAVEAYNTDGEGPVPQTLLAWATSGGSKRAVEFLLHRGAGCIRIQDCYGQTPLSLAARWGREEVVRLLLDYGADIEARDSQGQTPLSSAAGWGRETVVRLLLDCGADMEALDDEGKTPLKCAEEHMHEGVVRLLLDHGADSKYHKSRIFGSLKVFLENEKPDLVNFYPQDGRKLQIAAAKATLVVEALSTLGCSYEMAIRFSILTLYDLVLLVG